MFNISSNDTVDGAIIWDFFIIFVPLSIAEHQEKFEQKRTKQFGF